MEGVVPTIFLYEGKINELEKQKKQLEIENNQINLLNRNLIDKIEKTETDLILLKGKVLMDKDTNFDLKMFTQKQKNLFEMLKDNSKLQKYHYQGMLMLKSYSWNMKGKSRILRLSMRKKSKNSKCKLLKKKTFYIHLYQVSLLI